MASVEEEAPDRCSSPPLCTAVGIQDLDADGAAARGLVPFPAGDPGIGLTGDPLVEAVVQEVRAVMARYDGSHDFSHIRRVVGWAGHLTAEEEKLRPSPADGTEQQQRRRQLDHQVITLCALLHDVGDRKYLDVTEVSSSAVAAAAVATPLDPGSAAIAAVLRRCGAADRLIDLVPLLCRHVSWSHETASPEAAAATAAVVADHPELAIVQDADRLDALGAVGVARCFAFGAARGGRGGRGSSLQHSLDHFDEKLLLVELHMKTAAGRQRARQLTARLRTFQAWFRQEAALAVSDPDEPV